MRYTIPEAAWDAYFKQNWEQPMHITIEQVLLTALPHLLQAQTDEAQGSLFDEDWTSGQDNPRSFFDGLRFDPQTRNRTGRSLHTIPDTTTASVLLEVLAFDQISEVLLQGVAAGPGQLDGLGHRDTPMLAGELDDLQGQRR